MGFDFAEKPAKFIESVESYLDILISFRTMKRASADMVAGSTIFLFSL